MISWLYMFSLQISLLHITTLNCEFCFLSHISLSHIESLLMFSLMLLVDLQPTFFIELLKFQHTLVFELAVLRSV